MNSTARTTHSTTTRQVDGGARARRAGALSIAGALVALALTPTIAHADQSTGDGGATTRSSDIDDVVTARKQQMARDFARLGPSHSVSAVRYVFKIKAGCDIPQTLDEWSRRLIAVQDCSKARLVPARTLARVAYGEPIPDPELGSTSVGHCGHEALHQPSAAAGLPVSSWYTPTSC